MVYHGKNHEKRRQSAGCGFRRDASGSVTIMFAMSMVPALMAVALAVEYQRRSGYGASLQAAADQTALALTRTLTSTTTGASLNTPAANMLSVYGTTATPISLVGSVTLSNNNSQLCLTAQQTVPLTLGAGIFPVGQPISVTSCAAAQGSGTFEVALVMDNTGSMASTTNGRSKLYYAQQAALNLIQQLNPAGATPTATFSIVPFTTSVNVGTAYANASWMDTSALSSAHWKHFTRPSGAPWNPTSRFDLFTKMGATWAGCVEERPDPYLTTDTAPSSSTPDTLFVPYLWPDEGDIDGTGSATLPGATFSTGGWRNSTITYNSSNWDLGSASNNYLYDYGGSCSASNDTYEAADVGDAISRGSGATKVCKYKGATGVSSSVSSYGPNRGCMSNPLVTLTQDSTTLTNKINSMVAGGNTNLLAGFMWGWRTISPNGPFTSATIAPKAYNTANNTKVIVFLTDGMNTWNTNSSYAYKSEYNALGYFVDNRLSNYGGVTYPMPDGSANASGSTTSNNYRDQMDAAVLAACNNAKAANVIVYTVGFSIQSDQIDTQGQALLQKCATDGSHAYIATDGTALLTAFNSIGTGLGKLRLVR